MVDSLHASDLVRFYLSPMTDDAPADSAKSWFTDTMPSASGAIVYNNPGSEKTIIAGKSAGAYGHMLQLNYDDTYLRILRYRGGSWMSTDWEKIKAGYADSAGSVTINYNNDSNSTYQMLWGSGTHIYGTSGIYCNPYYDNIYAANFYTTSDRAKKQNISSFSEHIRKFQLRDTEKWHYGVIAQEVPEMFRDGEEGNMTVNYPSILSFYVGQLENKVRELEERIRILETK